MRPRPRTEGLQDAFSCCWLSHSSVDLFHRQAAGGVELEGEEVGGLLPGTPSTDKSAFSHPSPLQLFYPPPSPWPQLLGEGVLKPACNYSFQGARWMTTASTTNSEWDSQALILPQSFHPQLGSREKIKLWWRRGGVELPEAAFQIFPKLAFKIWTYNFVDVLWIPRTLAPPIYIEKDYRIHAVLSLSQFKTVNSVRELNRLFH